MIVSQPSPDLLDRLAELHAAAFSAGPRPWSATEIASLAAPPAGCLVVDDPADPSGFLLLRRAADEAELLTIAVDPARWNQGRGRALLTAGLGWCAGQGVRTVYLEVAESNLRGQRLYAGHGFERVGRRPGYFGLGVRDAAILMARRLDTLKSRQG